MLGPMSTSATTRRARLAALLLAGVMVLTVSGSALLGTTGSDPTPAQPAPTTEAVTDLADLSDAELAALLEQYGAAPTPTASADPAPAP